MNDDFDNSKDDKEMLGRLTMSDDSVLIYSEGPLALSVCAPASMTVEEVTAEVNRQNHCGTMHGWVPSKDPTFLQGGPNPGPCERDATRKHYLYEA